MRGVIKTKSQNSKRGYMLYICRCFVPNKVIKVNDAYVVREGLQL